MMAKVTLEFSSEGPGPSQVDTILRRAGLARHGASYALRYRDEAELHVVMDRLHEALRGTGVRYTVLTEGAEPVPRSASSRDEVFRWVEAGALEEGLVSLLESDPAEFRKEAHRALDAAVDHIISRHRAEDQQRREREHRGAVKEQISILLRTAGARHFQEILDTFDMDEAALTSILHEMIEEGTVAARQEGHHVIYLLSTPALRANPR